MCAAGYPGSFRPKHKQSGGAFNRYWYANNNPYLLTDPDGRQSLPREMNRVSTLPEAKGHWQEANGRSVRVPISAVNLQGLANGKEFTNAPAVVRAGDAIKDFESNNDGLRPTSVGVSWLGKGIMFPIRRWGAADGVR